MQKNASPKTATTTPNCPRTSLRSCRSNTALWIVLLVLIAIAANAEPAGWSEANSKMRSGDFAGARAGYEALISAGESSPELFYNAAIAAEQAGDRGTAALYFRRALLLDPLNTDARDRLKRITPVTEDWFRDLLTWVPLNFFGTTAALAFWAGLLMLAWMWFRPGTGTRARGIAALLLLLVSGALAAGAANVSRDLRSMVVIKQETAARTLPAKTAPVVRTLNQGALIHPTASSAGWIAIELGPEEHAWVEQQSLAPLRP
jgi:tetratricopeptide (TPR) repeat protein